MSEFNPKTAEAICNAVGGGIAAQFQGRQSVPTQDVLAGLAAVLGTILAGIDDDALREYAMGQFVEWTATATENGVKTRRELMAALKPN